jgi:hypothetical protein
MTTEVMNYRLAFVGTLTAVLAIIGFFSRRQGSGLARTIMLVTAGVATVGLLGRLAYEIVPGMNVFYPYGRLAGWFALGAVLAAAIGFDALAGWFGGTNLADRAGCWPVVPIAGVLIAVLTVAQLVPLGRNLNPPFQTRDDADWFPETPLIEAARALQTRQPPRRAPGPDRVGQHQHGRGRTVDPAVQPPGRTRARLDVGVRLDAAPRGGPDAALPRRPRPSRCWPTRWSVRSFPTWS